MAAASTQCDTSARAAFFPDLLLVGIRKASRVSLGIVVHEDTVGVALQIVELPATRRPEQEADGNQSEKDHARDETVDDVHEIRSNGYQLLFCPRNRVRMRAELTITARELRGIDRAATSGVIREAMASGTMIRL
jgi:hypothetical protein